MQINPTTYSVTWFKDRKNESSLVLKPPYQRKPVWTYRQKAYLIDTIIKKYQIPEIYVHRVTDDDGRSIYNIVDGQQRVRSILEFIDGEVPLSEDYNPEYADYEFKDLPGDIRRHILNHILYVREITDASEEEVRNLFKRMNLNVVALNSQELRHATYSGEFIRLMEEIAEDEFWAENKIVTPNEIRRMKDVEFISDLFVSMIHGIQDKTKELDDYYQLYEPKFEDKQNHFKMFLDIKNIIYSIFPDLKETRWRNKSDFYTLFIVFSELIKKNYLIPQQKYSNIKADLLKFAETIDVAVKKVSKGRKLPKEVANYVNAVTKSTTDKDRRVTRHKIILKIISKYAKGNK